MGVIGMNVQDDYSTLSEDATLYLDYINERLKVQDYGNATEEMLRGFIDLACERRLTKVVTHCQAKHLRLFKEAGFVIEGIIKGFFKGVDAYCVSYFTDEKRADSKGTLLEDRLLNQCFDTDIDFRAEKSKIYWIRNAYESDLPHMISLYTDVFKVYPIPVFDVEYYSRILDGKTLCKVAVQKDRVVGVAAAHLDKANKNAEIVGCVTYQEFRGRGIASNLVYSLEQDLKKRNYSTIYGFSASLDPAMNRIFRKHGYGYGGRLVNNNSIYGRFKDMNIWVKELIKWNL